jgi:hypothetical protein
MRQAAAELAAEGRTVATDGAYYFAVEHSKNDKKTSNADDKNPTSVRTFLIQS